MAKSLADKLKDHVKFVRNPPDGWLTASEFCERAGGMRVQQIYKGIESGKIPRKHLAITENSNHNRVVIIDWDAVAYDFLLARRPAYRPTDFKQNAAREYKPFKRSAQQEIAVQEEERRRDEITAEVAGGAADGDTVQDIVNERLVNDRMVVEPVIDTTSAKYRKEQLEIEKKQIELKVQANELISAATLRSMLAGIAAEISGAANRAIPAYGPILAAEENPTVVRQILKKIFADVLRPIVDNKENEDDEETGD